MFASIQASRFICDLQNNLKKLVNHWEINKYMFLGYISVSRYQCFEFPYDLRLPLNVDVLTKFHVIRCSVPTFTE